MVCEAKYRKPEYHDLLSAIEDIVEEAIGRDCDIVIGRVAAELSRQSKMLYQIIDEPGPAATDDYEGLYEPDPLWLTWCLAMLFVALGVGAAWAAMAWLE